MTKRNKILTSIFLIGLFMIPLFNIMTYRDSPLSQLKVDDIESIRIRYFNNAKFMEKNIYKKDHILEVLNLLRNTKYKLLKDQERYVGWYMILDFKGTDTTMTIYTSNYLSVNELMYETPTNITEKIYKLYRLLDVEEIRTPPPSAYR